MSSVVFLKLGGSVLTDKTKESVFLEKNVRRLGREIREALEGPDIRLVLGHGGGSFGPFPARRHKVREGLPGGGTWEGYWETRRAVLSLNTLILDQFASENLHVHVVQPSACALAEDGVLKEMDVSAVTTLVEAGQVPMVFGDAVLDSRTGFTIISTEALFAYLARFISATRVVLACDVPGVLDFPRDAVIPRIDESNADDVLERLSGSSGVDVTGGMVQKVQVLWKMVKEGLCSEARIISGSEPRAVRDAILGCYDGGTLLIYDEGAGS